MLLQDKIAVIHGAAGAIGAATAKTFAAEGARVFLAGRTLEPVERVAKEITAAGGRAHAAQVDALDPYDVQAHADAVAAEAGRIDVVFNAIGVAHVQGVPLVELSVDDYLLPITTYATTQLVTSVAAARHMVRKGSGVIVTLSTTAARATLATDGFGPACAAVEALSRQLAGELAPHGIRVACLRADVIPETVDRGSHVAEILRRIGESHGMTLEQFRESPGLPGALLQRPLTLDDVANTAAFLAADRAAGITAVITDVSRGAVVG